VEGMIVSGSFGEEDGGVEEAEENQAFVVDNWGCGVLGIGCGNDFIGGAESACATLDVDGSTWSVGG